MREEARLFSEEEWLMLWEESQEQLFFLSTIK
jgi:hypothetical protein